MNITIKETGTATIHAALSRLAAMADDISPTFPLMEAEFRKIELAQFLTEGAQGDTGAFAPLAAGYAAWKRARFPGKTILRLTDTLFHSLIRRGPYSFVETSRNRLAIGTTVPYAARHQIGSSGRRRPPISITNAQAARFASILHKYFGAELRRAMRERVAA
jgi:phage gpG-like protein